MYILNFKKIIIINLVKLLHFLSITYQVVKIWYTNIVLIYLFFFCKIGGGCDSRFSFDRQYNYTNNSNLFILNGTYFCIT